jgi:TrfA protein
MRNDLISMGENVLKLEAALDLGHTAERIVRGPHHMQSEPLKQKLDEMKAKRLAKAAKKAQQVEDGNDLPRQMSLFQDDLRAIPNHIARSPLFSSISRGARSIRDNEVVPSPAGVQVRYSGPQLDQGDCDVFMQLVYEHRGKTVGEAQLIVRDRFLKEIGRPDGGSMYAWLTASLRRLQKAFLTVDSPLFRYDAPLVGEVLEDKEKKTFMVSLHAGICDMFAPHERSLIDWKKRAAIEKREHLSKWVHNFTASHTGVDDGWQFHAVENLRTWAGYASPLRKFVEALGEALEELERVGVIEGGAFYERKNPDGGKRQKMVKWRRL